MKFNVLKMIIVLIIYGSITKGDDNIIANKQSIVTSADVRFTILTPRLIRMEWDSTKNFIDYASFVVVNRNLPTPRYSASKKMGWLIIKTEEAELRYKINSGKFTSENLKITYLKDKRNTFIWKPGAKQKYNLKGTYKTLDTYNGDVNKHGEKLQLEEGILSRDGWFFLDDSKSFLFDDSDWQWVTERKNKNGQDWYFMAYGKDYKAALKDYTEIAGKVPLPPRYAFGYWWSRYWAYSDNELRRLVGNFERFNIPLDVLVIDMDWHLTDSLWGKPDEFGERQMWTGWTWNKNLFTSPSKFLQWTKTKNLKTTLNLHPASGIAPYENQYSEFAKRTNFDTTSRRNIPYEGSNKKFMQNLFNVVLHPMQKDGIDFWWLDWQQWPHDKKITDLDNTWWLNYTFFSDMELNSDKRPLLYHRWGGLGNHRYQIGFSGDAIISWESLAYQPYFTNTASNVLYGYWSHDIGGHMFKVGDTQTLNPELYTRWMQYGALSPIFRTHSTKDARLNKEIWNFRGDYFNAQYDAIQLRYTLSSYIYTMARKTYNTGISLCRPMYYEYPDKEEAYSFDKQYFFGDDILVAPIGKPMTDGFSKIKVWLPEGNDWYEWHTGTLLKGGQTVEREFSLDEYPIYIKAGAIIPMVRDAKNLDKESNKITLGIFPGGISQSELYEDNGNDKNYQQKYAYTHFKSEKLEDGSIKISISPREGEYNEMEANKLYQIKLYGSQMPSAIHVNGKSLNYSNEDGESWNYTGADLSVNIKLSEMAASQSIVIQVYFDNNQFAEINNGLIEKLKRLNKATTELKIKRGRIVVPTSIGQAEETNLKLEYHPENFKSTINDFNKYYEDIPRSIRTLNIGKEVEEWYLNYLGFYRN